MDAVIVSYKLDIASSYKVDAVKVSYKSGSCLLLVHAQVHIILMAELGSSFTEGVACTPGLSAWSNTLQYAWKAHSRCAE